MNVPSYFAPHLPFYRENYHLHFIRHHRSFPPDAHACIQAEKKCLLSLWATATTKFNPNHSAPIMGRHAPLHFWQAFTIRFYYSALTKMLIPWEAKLSLYEFLNTNKHLKGNVNEKPRWHHFKATAGEGVTRNPPLALRRGGMGEVSSLYKVGWAELESGKVRGHMFLNSWAVWQ